MAEAAVSPKPNFVSRGPSCSGASAITRTQTRQTSVGSCKPANVANSVSVTPDDGHSFASSSSFTRRVTVMNSVCLSIRTDDFTASPMISLTLLSAWS